MQQAKGGGKTRPSLSQHRTATLPAMFLILLPFLQGILQEHRARAEIVQNPLTIHQESYISLQGGQSQPGLCLFALCCLIAGECRLLSMRISLSRDAANTYRSHLQTQKLQLKVIPAKHSNFPFHFLNIRPTLVITAIAYQLGYFMLALLTTPRCHWFPR